eukprot:2023423-Prorocentrum_lima.AAC.1
MPVELRNREERRTRHHRDLCRLHLSPIWGNSDKPHHNHSLEELRQELPLGAAPTDAQHRTVVRVMQGLAKKPCRDMATE